MKAYEESFLGPNKWLLSTPILVLTEDGMEFDVFRDVLQCYENNFDVLRLNNIIFLRTTEEYKNRYPTHELELAIMVFPKDLVLLLMWGKV